MYPVKQMTDASLPEIGRHFGGKHHYVDLSKIKIDLKDQDISEGNTKGGFDPVLVELKRFAQKRWASCELMNAGVDDGAILQIRLHTLISASQPILGNISATVSWLQIRRDRGPHNMQSPLGRWSKRPFVANPVLLSH
jgi:hypothetical protein